MFKNFSVLKLLGYCALALVGILIFWTVAALLWVWFVKRVLPYAILIAVLWLFFKQPANTSKNN